MITDTRSHEIVAFKEIRSGSGKTRPESLIQTTERLHQYIKIGRSLQHSNISHAYGLIDGFGALPLLVLPYFSNGNVVDYLKNCRGKTKKDKLTLAKDIIKGLVYLHDMGVIHGNIHGANVLVSEGGSAVLCDIQMDAVTFSNKGYYPIHSKCWWMPYERLVEGNSGDQCHITPPSKPADIYATALTIMQMWTLQRPFYHIRHPYKLITTLQNLKSGELAGFERPNEVPADVWAVLHDCLSVSPQSRPTAAIVLGRFEAL
jgi:serine/threonine protein kinase